MGRKHSEDRGARWRRRARTPALLAALLVPGADAPVHPPAQAPEQAERIEPARAGVPTRTAGGLVFLDVERLGREPLLALLDTGASASAIDPRHARDLAVLEVADVVGTTGTFAAEVVEVAGLSIGGRALPALRATRRDLAGLLAPPGCRVDLILGSDALRELVVTIDFAARRLELGRASSPREGTPMALDNGIPTLPATLGGVETVLRIDTGASLFETDDVYVNVPTRLWERIAARHPDLAPTGRLAGTGADGATVELPVYALAGAVLGPLTCAEVRVIVQPTAGYFAAPDAKGFVGNNLLAKLGRVTLDYPARRLRTEP